MTVDPVVKTLLDQMAAMNMPAFSDLQPEQARAMYRLSRGASQPEDVTRVADVTLKGADGPIAGRLYAGDEGAHLPCVVYYHGGGWVIGDLETHDGLCRMIANRVKCVVVAVDYRLAPENKFPAAAEDAYAALLDVQARAAELGIDPSRIAVVGDSAGGNLSAVVAQMARDRSGPSMRLQVLMYPVTDYDFETASYKDNADGYMLTAATMRWFWDNYVGSVEDGVHPYASPLRAKSLAGLPPALVITAEYDPLRDEGDAYAARLREAGVAVQHSPYAGMIHGFVHMNEVIPTGVVAVEEVSAALRAAFASG